MGAASEKETDGIQVAVGTRKSKVYCIIFDGLVKVLCKHKSRKMGKWRQQREADSFGARTLERSKEDETIKVQIIRKYVTEALIFFLPRKKLAA